MRPAHFLGSLLWVILLSASLAAQGRPTGGGGTGSGGGSRTTTGNPGSIPNSNIPPIMNNPNLSTTPMPLFLSGKVRIDDGSELTDAATIESMCSGDRHFEAYTDRKGNFSFEFGKQRTMGNDDVATTSSSDMPGQPRTALQQRRELQQCELIAVLPGFTSQAIELSAVDVTESMNVGTIVLHRLAHVEGFTISATTAMAPPKAKKAFEKGKDEEQKKKWDAAEKKFQEAVQLYPKFAAAWLELGRMQLQRKDESAARQSWQQAVAADPQFVTPHQLLAGLAFQQQQWQEVLDQTGAVVRLNPLSFAGQWYYSSVANYYLGHYEEAERSARKGIQADVEHRIPKLEYLLGVILARKHEFQGATEHMRNYVRLAPKAPDVAQVNEQIAKIEKLSSTQSATQK
ncbi:MAG TPA: tetratricopeptide repeat protein [Terriglobales bacterium]|nr:tetratricopeptide repeat protein [Terriglobales bacterium]